MRVLLLLILVFLVIAISALALWRQSDRRADRAEMDRLIALQPSDPPVFFAEMVVGLPEAAQRYFAFSIAEGTPLYTVARIEMEGRFSLGTRDASNYMDTTATQVLAAPHGFVWRMSGGSGLMRVSGSDCGRWTRFWLAGLAPVARVGVSEDFSRSALAVMPRRRRSGRRPQFCLERASRGRTSTAIPRVIP
jgi:hypothetical protein